MIRAARALTATLLDPPTVREYAAAGSPSPLTTARLHAAGFTAEHTRTLVAHRVDFLPSDLPAVARILADRPGAGPRAYLVLRRAPSVLRDCLNALPDILDSTHATDFDVLRYLRSAFLPVTDVAHLLITGMPWDTFARITSITGSIRVDPRDLARAWRHLAAADYDPADLLGWAQTLGYRMRHLLFLQASEETIELLLTWRDAAGPDAPWCHAAGLSLDEARHARATGTMPGRDALTVLAGLRSDR